MIGGPWRRAGLLWRRSLQLRVVLGTVALSAVVVFLVGWILTRQITNGLVQDRVDVSVAEAARSSADVQSSLSAASSEGNPCSAIQTMASARFCGSRAVIALSASCRLANVSSSVCAASWHAIDSRAASRTA